MIGRDNTVAVVLGGGVSRRMKGLKKPRLELAGESLLSRVIRRVEPQVSRVLVNLNEPVDNAEVQRHTVVPDAVTGFPGPLTGLDSAFGYLAVEAPLVKGVLLVPCDGPFLPEDLLSRLAEGLNISQAAVACASYGGEAQPTFSLWRRETSGAVHSMLAERKRGGFRELLKELDTVYVRWPESALDPFFNINTPEDLARAENLLKT